MPLFPPDDQMSHSSLPTVAQTCPTVLRTSPGPKGKAAFHAVDSQEGAGAIVLPGGGADATQRLL